jgi:hypothetical protein
MSADTGRALAAVFIGRLNELTDAHLKAPVETKGDDEDWGWIGPAMVARIIECSYALQSPIVRGLELDAGALTRHLFNHMVTFAYVGDNPEEYLLRFIKSDYQTQLTTHKEFAELELGNWIDPSKEEHMKTVVADSSVASLPDVRSMCVYLDKSWNLSGESSFLGLYATVFRQFSTIVHPTLRSLYQHAHRVPEGYLIGLSNIDDELVSVSLEAPAILARALEASSRTLGWPDHNRVHEVLSRYTKALALTRVSP